MTSSRALRRLRAASGFVEMIEVISHDPAAAPSRRCLSWSFTDRDPCSTNPADAGRHHRYDAAL